MTLTADIAIIGGGIAGLSLAAAIGGRARVVLLEAEPELFHHTSSRSAEQMQPTYGPAPVRRLTTASIPMVQAIAERSGSPIFTPRPLLWLSYVEARDHLDHLLATVPGLEEIGTGEAVGLLPALRVELLLGAAVDRSAVEVRVPMLLDAYRSAALDGGVRILASAQVERAERVGEDWRLTAGEHTVVAPVVVDAAGPWAERAATLFGAAGRGLVPKRRTVAVAVPTGRPVEPGWAMAADVADAFYFRPRGDAVLACALEDEPSEPEDAKPRP
ncbi:MAG: D-arginine dehydrogenase, partial [Microbacteriaceae bacterium]|nr:D-arginine dehydrogenase [Microbacteriaceae bacterium]